ncbi:uncharacterized protein LOC142880052, partial [Nelusetta ayraudi]|uniref:uncharacterized protein LOC142880052 n=1 Tax=Nelusetta ayraudi TaxID=303726 RepID=UPI003F71AA14
MRLKQQAQLHAERKRPRVHGDGGGTRRKFQLKMFWENPAGPRRRGALDKAHGFTIHSAKPQPGNVKGEKLAFSSEKKSSEKKSSEKKSSEKKGSEKRSEKKGSEKKSSEKKSAEKKSLEKKSSEKKSLEKKSSEKKSSEKKSLEKKSSEKKMNIPESRPTQHAAVMEAWLLLLCLSNRWMQTVWTASVAPTLTPAPVTPTEDQSTQLVDWLMKYGYLPAPDPSTGQLQAWTSVTSAVKAMQRFAGLRDTGVLDEETLVLMKSPRCSLPDQDQAAASAPNRQRGSSRRRRRGVAMWTRRNINWRLRSYPSSSRLSREMIRSLVYYALRVWSEPTPLDFHE